MLNLQEATDRVDLILHAAMTGTECQDVQVITLKSYHEEQMLSLAMEQHLEMLVGFQPNMEKFERRVGETLADLRANRTLPVRQFIQTDKTGTPTLVCLDVDNVDDSIFHNVICALSEVDYGVGKTEFGPTKTFKNDPVDVDRVLNNMSTTRYV
jgi:hypothetical protein